MRRKTISIAEGTAKAVAILDCPEWLGEHGKRKWNEVIRAFFDVRPVETLDVDCLAMYCEAHDEMHRAMATLAKLDSDVCEGTNGSLYPHPAVGQKNKAIDRIRKFGRELGINRSVRKAAKTQQRLPAKSKPA